MARLAVDDVTFGHDWQSDTVTRVAGVDGCRGGWAVAVIEVELDAPADLATAAVAANRLNPTSAPIRLRHRSFDVIRHLTEVIADPDLAVICIDIPIGLPGPSGTRACDIQARHLLSPHGARVFAAPVRPTLDHIDDYRAACAISREVCGRALSKQAWHILGKIAEADAVATDPRLLECHPEVSFALLQGGTPITATKRSASGRAQRVALLSDVIERLPITDLPRGDDHLDALACAWSAARVVAGRAMTLPTDPGIRGDRGLDSAGRRMRIVG
jgi:predicted RNase H-like nuclease